jgi:hypothetical protein
LKFYQNHQELAVFLLPLLDILVIQLNRHT